MSDVYTITVRPFEMGEDKAAALKPLEEAAEVYASWKDYDYLWHRMYNASEDAMWAADEALADEIADCIIACCNLVARYGLDLDAAIERVEKKNRERGRYE